jgi:hypothetical protein
MRTITEKQYSQYLQFLKIGEKSKRALPKLLEFQKLLERFQTMLKEQQQREEVCRRLWNRESRKLGFRVDSDLNLHHIRRKGARRGRK